MNNPPPPPPVIPAPGRSEKYKGVKHTILVMSGKGGVGKSTIAVNLAVTLADMGYKVGLIDADISGPDDPKMLGVSDGKVYADEKGIVPLDTNYGVKVISMAFLLPSEDTAVIWRGALRHKAVQQFLEDVIWTDTDYVIMDFPPGTGDEALTVAQLIPQADGAIIVITPQDVAVLDASKAISFANQLKINVLGVVENMSGFICPHCGKKTDIFKSGSSAALSKKYGISVLSQIPFFPDVVTNADEGIPAVRANKEMEMIFRKTAESLIQKTKERVGK
ncbi:MAG: Mrp/NBP35 family ATP-binding protein [Thermoplasmataceae archaeon]